MKISEVAINRPVFASMTILALVVFGATAYMTIGVDLFPEVEFPIVTVTVIYPGADPETVETEITDKIEEAVNTIAGIKTLRSESTEGIAQIFIEFKLSEDVNVVSQDVRDKVAAIRRDLPPEIEPPIIEKFDINSSPILAIVVSGPDSIRRLSQYADREVKPRIEGVSGVGNVRLVGDREREIRIWLRADDLLKHNIEAQDVIDTLQTENLEPPGGRVETSDMEMIVKTKGKIENVADFADLIVAHREGTPIHLHNVARVDDGQEDFRSLARLNQERAVSLLVRRQSGENMLQVADEVKRRLDRLRDDLPPGYDLIVAQDLSIFVDQSISEAQGELIRGGVLAVLVILLFLRSLRGSFVAAITIPTTIISTFTFMMAMGFTMNMMTMLALTISVGMIVDDSIVVLENSYRHLEAGMTRMKAALAGISEIGFAVIATSLAIVAVFVPVAFMEGIVGQFFFEFGLTVTFAVVVSTFIAVTLSPMLCSRVLKVSKQHGRFFNVSERIFQRIETAYGKTLRWALGHRAVVLLAAAGIFVGSMAMTGLLGTEFVPQADEDQFNIQVETPIGTAIGVTSADLEQIEALARDMPGVEDVFTTIGAGVEERVNVATVLVRLAPKADRDFSQMDLMQQVRQQIKTRPELEHMKISVEMIPRVGGGGFRTAPVQYNIRGTDLAQLAEFSDRVTQRMKQVSGIEDVNSTYDAGKPQINVEIDRDKAADLHVSVDKLGKAVYALIGGQEVSQFEQDGESYDVRIRLAGADRDDPESILRVPVRNKLGQLKEAREMVDVHRTKGPVQIDRQDRSRQVTVLANLDTSMKLDAAVAAVVAIEKDEGLPPGTTSKFTGDAEMQAESFANIIFSMALAAALIYMVLAAQFESLIHPLTVMLSLPLSVVGALGLLAVTGRTLNIFSMIGMIMLMGLVTKNAILLVDYTNLLRSRGMSKTDALLEAGPVRLRPILMTAMSTMAGMTPVAIGMGSGAETRAPMGTAIVGGLITSTILTLVVIPVVYSTVDDLAGWVRRMIFGPEVVPEADVSV